MRHITTAADWILGHYETLPGRVKQSALPCLLASGPMVISSLLGAYIVMPAVVILTVLLIYKLTTHTDGFMFEMTKADALYKVTMPLCSFISVWGISLAIMGRNSMLNGVVGPYCLVLLLACAPAYRWNQLRMKRRAPLGITFGVVGTLAVLASLVHVTD